MKTFFQTTSLLLLAASLANAQNTSPKGTVFTLNDFVGQTVGTSQDVQVKKLTFEQNEAAVAEKKTAFLPTVNATVTANKDGHQNGVADTGQQINSNALDQGYQQSKLNMNMNLFNGFQDSAALKSSQHLSEVGKLNWSDMRYQQVVSAIESFFTVLQYQSDYNNQQKEISINEKSLKEAERRIKYGGARRTEVISLQSTIATNKTALSDTQASLNQEKIKAIRLLNLEIQEFDLAYQAGRCQGTNIKSLIDKMNPQNRSDIKAQEASVAAEKENLNAVQNAKNPSLDFTSSYILSDNQTISQKDSYNLALTLTIPFPFGLEKKAQEDQARKSYAIAQVTREKTLRDINQARAQLAQQLTDDLSSIKNLGEAKTLNEKNVKALTEDHRSGLSTYSDVLDAFTTYQQTLRKYDKAILQLDLDCYRALVWSADETQLLALLKEEIL